MLSTNKNDLLSFVHSKQYSLSFFPVVLDWYLLLAYSQRQGDCIVMWTKMLDPCFPDSGI